MQINATITGGDTIRQLLIDTQSQVPFATALALTRTGQIIKKNLITEMKKVFNNPTPYTINSLQLTPAKKTNLTTEVWFKGMSDYSPQHYLRPQVHGGIRPLKRSERALLRSGYLSQGWRTVPGQGIKLNKYGNVTPGQITRIMSALRIQRDVLQNTTKVTPIFGISELGKSLPPGVWERTSTGVKPLLIFVSHARYRRRLQFFEIAKKTYEQNYRAEFNKAFDQAVGTSGFKGKW